jgi:uncharacterized phage infection (PIP) family protein YhgE
MTDKGDDETVVKLKANRGKNKRKNDTDAETRDDLDGLLRDLFNKSGFSPDAEAVKYQIAQSAAQIRAAYAPLERLLSQLAEINGKMVERLGRLVDMNGRMVDGQNRMVEAIQDLQDKVAELEDHATRVENQMDRKYQDDLVARIVTRAG